MLPRLLVGYLAAAFLCCEPAHAANWFSLDALSAASGLGIEVDLDSLRSTGMRREAVVRVSYPAAQVHGSGAAFRSAVATVEFECEGGLVGYRDAVFYSEAKGNGAVTAREEGRLAPIPEPTRELLPAKNLEVLIRAACSRPTPAVP